MPVDQVQGGDSGQVPLALVPEDREEPTLDCEVVRIRIRGLSLWHPRQRGACWLGLMLWERLDLDRF